MIFQTKCIVPSWSPEPCSAWSRHLFEWNGSDHWKHGENCLDFRSDPSTRAIRSTSAENPAQSVLSLEMVKCALNPRAKASDTSQFLGTRSQEYIDKNQHKHFPRIHSWNQNHLCWNRWKHAQVKANLLREQILPIWKRKKKKPRRALEKLTFKIESTA